MSRPSGHQIDVALDILKTAAGPDQHRALRVIRRALEPRTVWSSKEVADALGVDPSNLKPGKMVGFELLAEPFQTLPRPSATNDKKVMRLWWADDVLEHPKAKELAASRRVGKGWAKC
jgi:hypothetical protein